MSEHNIAVRVSWKMVREEEYKYFEKANEPKTIYSICSQILEGEPVENVIVVSLNTKLKIVEIGRAHV